MKRTTLCIFLLIAFVFELYPQAQIFVFHRRPNSIKAFDLNGTLIDTLATDTVNSISMHWNILDNKLYFSNYRPGIGYYLQRCNADGSERENVLGLLNALTDFDLNPTDQMIYWVGAEDKTIYKSDFDGLETDTILSTPESEPVSISIDPEGQKIYWMSYNQGRNNDKIHRANLDGSGREVIIDSLETPARLLYYNNKIYWSNDGDPQAIKRANADGSHIEVLRSFSDNEYPFAIQIDPNTEMLYWADYGSNTISRMLLSDTSRIEVIISEGIRTPTALALAIEAVNIGGTITDPTGQPLAGVNISLSGSVSRETVSDTSGQYIFEGLPKGGNYILIPSWEEDTSTNLSLSDILLVAQHLLGLPSFSSPFQMIAADIDGSKTVTTLDLLQIRSRFLSEVEGRPLQANWRFIPSDHVFQDPFNPWNHSLPSAIRISGLETDFLSGSFIGIKKGKVDFSLGN